MAEKVLRAGVKKAGLAISRAATWALAVALAAGAVACGKKGDPAPPPRVIPNAASDLTAAQRGDGLVFRFAYPQTTTAGAKLPGLAAVEVWEVTRPLPPSGDPPIVEAAEFAAGARRLVTLAGAELQSAIEGGEVVVRLPLPPPPAGGRQAFYYAVRTTAVEGETSGWSNVVRLVPQPSPPPLTDIQVEPRAGGIEISWRAADGAAGFRVYRRQAESRTWDEPLVTLPGEARSHLDTSARYGQRYIYTVTALASREPAVESAFAAEREVDYEDRFAPAPPEDLVVLPESAGANLVWKPSPDADAVGYVVYRRDPGADFRRLDEQPVGELKYADSGLAAGLVYHYRVTAVDAAGNEGPPTPEAEARPR
jgi:fibronectin type 3 domain-containing protein